MSSKRLVAPVAGLLVLLSVIAAQAQDARSPVASDYLISAKAGGVNYVEGKVSVFRKTGTSGYLVAGDEINIGDRVTTSSDGKAEILLNPGSYLRIGGSTSFDFISTDLENLKVNLRTGSAIFEVYASREFKVSVKMPQSSLELTRSGVFRLDVLMDGTSRLSVFKGKVFLNSTEIVSGRAALLVRGGVSVTKFDRDTNDSLDLWSKTRGKDLARANTRLQRNALRNSLLASYNQRGWNMYNSFGLWVFDPFRRGWLFLPFGYGWGSPYGYDYGFSIWSCRLPWYVYNPPYNPPATTGGGGTPSGPAVTPVVTAGNRDPIPPFVRMQGGGSSTGSSSGGGEIINSNRGRRDSGPIYSPSSAPTYSPPPSSPPSSPPASTERSDSKGKPGR